MSGGGLPLGWRHELDPAADAIARRLRRINTELDGLPSLFSVRSPEVAQSPPPLVPSWRTAKPSPRRVPAELSRPGDASYTKDTDDVCKQLLHADFHEIDVCFDDP